MATKAINPGVEAAQQALDAKRAELKAAEDHVRQLRKDVDIFSIQLQEARVRADDGLPRCSMISVARFTGKRTDLGEVVIVRKTASGQLVVRGVGSTHELRFKPTDHGSWREIPPQKFSDAKSLENVPAQFKPPKKA